MGMFLKTETLLTVRSDNYKLDCKRRDTRKKSVKRLKQYIETNVTPYVNYTGIRVKNLIK